MQYMVVVENNKENKTLNPYSIKATQEFQIGQTVVAIKANYEEAASLSTMLNEAFQFGVITGNAVNVREMKVK